MNVPPVNQGDGAPVLEIEGLDIRLPPGADRRLAVEGASLSLRAGETLCVVGESGSGKSTIADAVMGLLPRPQVEPVAGSIRFLGQDLLRLGEAEMRKLRGNRIGMVFQEPMTALNPVMTIGNQLREIFDAHVRLEESVKRERILRLFTDVGLPDPELLMDSYPFRLSGGQRQRVVIACALLMEPLLLIADEPTTALDVTTQAQILKLIKELQRKRNTAVLFITHDFGVVSEVADKVAVMQTGRIVEAGLTRDVLQRPKSDYTRQLIAAIPTGRPAAARTSRPSDHILTVAGLNKIYATSGGPFRKGRTVHAVRDASFSLARGETLGLVGESGSGKSTAGRCIVGLTPYDSGSILFRGQPVETGTAFRRAIKGKIQMIFQDPYASLNPRHRIGNTIASGPIAQGVPKAEARDLARELLDLVGLSKESAERYPHEFSGGQRQRIGIARALAMRPELIVADEPVSALDVSVQAQVLELFARIRDQFQLAMIFITHDLRVAGQMCDNIAVMKSGEIVEYGEVSRVLTHPSHPYTRSLIDAVPRLFGRRMASTGEESPQP